MEGSAPGVSNSTPLRTVRIATHSEGQNGPEVCILPDKHAEKAWCSRFSVNRRLGHEIYASLQAGYCGRAAQSAIAPVSTVRALRKQ